MTAGICDVGLIGLGNWGHNLALNFADRGYAVAGYDINPERSAELRASAESRDVHTADSLESLVNLLRRPRLMVITVAPGTAVDDVILGLLGNLESGDVVVDAARSHFKDTDRRLATLTASDIYFLGLGISGGRHGARRGACFMPGGSLEAYLHIQPMLEAAAASFQGQPSVAYLGTGSAGHYVQMVHDAIEYGLVHLVAETYHLMKQCLDFDVVQLEEVYAAWNDQELNSYVVQTAASVFRQVDIPTGRALIDVIADETQPRATAPWTACDALDRQVPMPAVEMAVTLHDLTNIKDERMQAGRILTGPSPVISENREEDILRLRRATFAAMILVFAQGMTQLRRASAVYGYGLHLEDVARIWRAGCTIRAAVLEDIREIYAEHDDLPNILLHPRIANMVVARQEDLRWAVRLGINRGVPVPVLAASLTYFDGYRSLWLPANLIQAMCDYFAGRGYQRIDQEGMFSNQWVEA